MQQLLLPVLLHSQIQLLSQAMPPTGPNGPGQSSEPASSVSQVNRNTSPLLVFFIQPDIQAFFPCGWFQQRLWGQRHQRQQKTIWNIYLLLQVLIKEIFVSLLIPCFWNPFLSSWRLTWWRFPAPPPRNISTCKDAMITERFKVGCYKMFFSNTLAL